MTRDEMIEAAAIAIREQAAGRLRHHHTKARPWRELPPRLQDEYRAEARAALESVGIVKSEV